MLASLLLILETAGAISTLFYSAATFPVADSLAYVRAGVALRSDQIIPAGFGLSAAWAAVTGLAVSLGSPAHVLLSVKAITVGLVVALWLAQVLTARVLTRRFGVRAAVAFLILAVVVWSQSALSLLWLPSGTAILLVTLVVGSILENDNLTRRSVLLQSVALGAAWLLRPQLAAVVAPLLVVVVLHPATATARIRIVAAAVASFFVVPGALAISGLAPALPRPTVGLNLFIGNGPGANGKFRTLDGVVSRASTFMSSAIAAVADSTQGSPSARSADSFWRARAIRHIRDDPVHWLGLLSKKLVYVVSSTSLPLNYDLTRVRHANPLASFRFISGGALLAAALVAALLAIARPARLGFTDPRSAALPYMFLFAVAAHVAFFIADEHRFTMLPLALPIVAISSARWTVSRDATLRTLQLLGTVLVVLIGATA